MKIALRHVATGVALVAVGLVTADAAAAPSQPRCGTPVLDALPAFTAGAERAVGWTAPEPTGNGFQLQVATDAGFSQIVWSDGNISSSESSRTVTGLAEGAHHYRLKAKTRPHACLASDWSAVETSVQDQTGPEVTVDHPAEDHVYVAEPFTVSGAVTDALSGPADVTVTATNTTTGVGQLQAPVSETADGSTGEWAVTFEGLLPGTYEIEVTAVDQVGNSSDAVTRSTLVIVTT